MPAKGSGRKRVKSLMHNVLTPTPLWRLFPSFFLFHCFNKNGRSIWREYTRYLPLSFSHTHIKASSPPSHIFLPAASQSPVSSLSRDTDQPIRKPWWNEAKLAWRRIYWHKPPRALVRVCVRVCLVFNTPPTRPFPPSLASWAWKWGGRDSFHSLPTFPCGIWSVRLYVLTNYPCVYAYNSSRIKNPQNSSLLLLAIQSWTKRNVGS